ncbi:MAG: hypothetical protein HZB16_05225 [Armatimonadetes bacterium]|nr:hypothetical protein [Armatimonadota bacterium]
MSTITLSATVREGTSLVEAPVAVLFNTTAGELSPLGGARGNGQQLRVMTQGGRAQATLRATTYETSALVTAALIDQANATTAQRTVTFGSSGTKQVFYDNIIKVTGAYLAYYPEGSMMVMEVLGDAAVSYQGVEIRASRLHLDVREDILVARDFQGRVSIGHGAPPYKSDRKNEAAPYFGDALVLDMRTFTGAIFSTQSGQTTHFTGRELRKTPAVELPTDAFDLYDVSGAKLQIRARRAVVYPNEKIRFDQPKFYMGDKKILSLPYYFEPLGYSAMGGGGFAQFVNYSSQDGLLVNFPYYFDMGDRSTNEVTLSRGERSGVFARQNGWQVYYRHHADLPQNKGDWDFTIDQIGTQFGVTYQRNQRFGSNSYSSFSLTWPEHRNLYSNANLYTTIGPGTLSATGNLDNLLGPGGGISNNLNVVWQSFPMRVKAIDSRFSVALGTGFSHSLSQQDLWRQSVSLSWDHDAWNFGPKASLVPYAGLRYQNTINGGQETAFTFNTTYRQDLAEGMTLGLGYTFDKAWNSQYKVPDRHVFSLDWQMTKTKLRGYAYANYNLVDQALSASVLFDYTLSRNWGLQAQTIYQSSSLGSFSETELWAYRMLGGRELRLRYNLERGRIFFEIDNQF